MGGGKGKGKQKSHRSAEEIQHDRAVNQRRDESSLPKKSTGSVSRSKARSAAYHAAMSAPVAADLIAEPKVRPPPPPPPRRGEGIRLVARDEILSHNPAQPGTSSKVSAPQPSEPKAQTGGEILPPTKSSPKKRDQEEQRQHKHKVHKRGEILPQHDQPEAGGSSQRLLPQDAMELNTSSSTEEEATSHRAAPGPKEHRDTRSGNEGNLASKQIVCLHGRVTCLGVPRDILRSIPPQLGSEWGGGPHGGPSGVILDYIARGSDKLAFEADGLVLKLSEGTQKEELMFSRKLPSVTATTYWIEKIQVHLHKEDGTVWHNYSLFLSCQEKAVRASDLLSSRGETWAFKFLAYVGCLLTWLTARGLSLKDTGTTNLGVKKETASQQQPHAIFYDTMSWTITQRPSFRWSGWLECTTKFCPAHSQWLKQAVLGAGSNPALAFSKLLAECQPYADVLANQGALVGGVMAEPTVLTMD